MISLLKHTGIFDCLVETTGLNCLMHTVKTRPTGIIFLQAALNFVILKYTEQIILLFFYIYAANLTSSEDVNTSKRTKLIN